MRCPEIVIAILNNPVHADPIAAIRYRGICDTRRLLKRSQERYSGFILNLNLAIDSNMPNIQGPAHGFISLLEHCGATCKVEPQGVIITHTDSGQKANLRLGSDAAFRRAINDFATRHILTALADRVNGTSKKYASRKDMIGITSVVDRNATFSTRKPAIYASIAKDSSEYRKKQQGTDDNKTALKNLWHRYLTTIIAGATRFGDRLLASKIWTTDQCDHPLCKQARCDAEHWNYSCHHNKGNIDKAQTARQEILDKINGSSYHGNQRHQELCTLFALPCLRISGICPERHPYTLPHARYGSARNR